MKEVQPLDEVVLFEPKVLFEIIPKAVSLKKPKVVPFNEVQPLENKVYRIRQKASTVLGGQLINIHTCRTRNKSLLNQQ